MKSKEQKSIHYSEEAKEERKILVKNDSPKDKESYKFSQFNDKNSNRKSESKEREIPFNSESKEKKQNMNSESNSLDSQKCSNGYKRMHSPVAENEIKNKRQKTEENLSDSKKQAESIR
jgi:hypothetical protein